MSSTSPIPDEPNLSQLVEQGLIAEVPPTTSWRLKMESSITQLAALSTNTHAMVTGLVTAITGDPADRKDLGMKGDITFLKAEATEARMRLDRLCTRVDALERTPGQKAEQRLVDWSSWARTVAISLAVALLTFGLAHVRLK